MFDSNRDTEMYHKNDDQILLNIIELIGISVIM